MTRRRPTSATAQADASGEGSRRVEEAVRAQQRLLAVAAARDAATVDDIHQSRVAARRLRSLLKTFGRLLDPSRAERYRADLRSYARGLAAVREADVRRDLISRIALHDESLLAADRGRIERLLEDACRGARESLQRQRGEPGWAALCRTLARYAAGDPLVVDRAASLGQVLAMVVRAWRKPVRLLEAGPESTEELHELRLALKHCRYALEPVADVAPKASAALLRRLRGAQDTIGEHRDVMLGDHWLRSNERALGRDLSDRLGRALERRERQLRRQAARRSRRVLEAYSDWRTATRRLRKESSPGRA